MYVGTSLASECAICAQQLLMYALHMGIIAATIDIVQWLCNCQAVPFIFLEAIVFNVKYVHIYFHCYVHHCVVIMRRC